MNGAMTPALARLLPSPRATPLATAMILTLVGAGATLRLAFPDDIDAVVAWTSTNVENLATHPIASIVASTFVVPSGLLPELILVAIGFTLLERTIGTLRTAAVALSGHVLATLLTEYGAYLLTDSATDRADVGVSYAMFAVLAAAGLRLTGRLRLATLAAIGAAVLIPLAISPGMTTTGHLLAATIGPLTMAALSRRRRGGFASPDRP